MPTAAAALLVHVVGQVRRPRVVRLTAGARFSMRSMLPADARGLS
jgi:hypothetical protein